MKKILISFFTFYYIFGFSQISDINKITDSTNVVNPVIKQNVQTGTYIFKKPEMVSNFKQQKDTVQVVVHRNNPDEISFFGICINPIFLEYGGSSAFAAVNGEGFFMTKGIRVGGYYSYIYGEDETSTEGNVRPATIDEKTFQYGVKLSLPLLKTTKESNEELELGYSQGINFIGNLKLKKLKYLALETSYNYKYNNYGSQSDNSIFLMEDAGETIEYPYFNLETKGLKGGLSYNIFNTYDYEPQDSRFNARSQNTYHFSIAANLIHNFSHTVGNLIIFDNNTFDEVEIEEHEVSIQNLEYNNIGYSLTLTRNNIKRFLGLSMELEIGVSPGYVGYSNEFINFKLGSTLGQISY